jgi:CarD family transcriptional regulator
MAWSDKMTERHGFNVGEFIVYPAHGVGEIVSIDDQEIAGLKLELFVIHFVKHNLTLRVPTNKIVSAGMRKLSDGPLIKRALETLMRRARITRAIWSRRVLEYEAKINSGDIVSVAEVVRDLYRSEFQGEQTYANRQLYEVALNRLSLEVAAVQSRTQTEAVREIEATLAEGPSRAAKPGTEEEVGEEEAA